MPIAELDGSDPTSAGDCDTYAPIVTVAKPSEGSRLVVEISPVSQEPSAQERFALDSLAEGYRVWIELSLLEAASEFPAGIPGYCAST